MLWQEQKSSKKSYSYRKVTELEKALWLFFISEKMYMVVKEEGLTVSKRYYKTFRCLYHFKVRSSHRMKVKL